MGTGVRVYASRALLLGVSDVMTRKIRARVNERDRAWSSVSSVVWLPRAWCERGMSVVILAPRGLASGSLSVVISCERGDYE